MERKTAVWEGARRACCVARCDSPAGRAQQVQVVTRLLRDQATGKGSDDHLDDARDRVRAGLGVRPYEAARRASRKHPMLCAISWTITGSHWTNSLVMFITIIQ